jgi:hypothetical protein
MPPFSVGFAQVEHRLGTVRRRLNLVTLQDAAYLAGTLVALAAALVISVAVRGQATLFAVAVWAAAAAVTTALVGATLRVRRRWLSVEQAVRFADRRAALDDRLATLLLDPARARDSRLRDILLAQILAATPRWDVETLAPRRVPRSLYALLAALAALVATSFLVRPPATPQSASTAMRPRPADERSGAGMPRLPPAGSPAGDSAELLSPGRLEHGGEGAERLGGTGAREGSRPGIAGESAGRLTARSGPQQADHPDQAGSEERSGEAGMSPQAPPNAIGSSPNLAEGTQDGMAERLQDAIRQAIGAPDANQKGRDETPGGQRREARADQIGSGSREQSRRDETESTSRDGRADKAPAPDAQAAIPGSGSAANPGGQVGPASTELFSKERNPGMPVRESLTMPLKLGAFAAMQPSQVEPQRQPPANSLPFASGGVGAPARLAEEQIPDAPLQKADVAPEHEAVVRRIFTRE